MALPESRGLHPHQPPTGSYSYDEFVGVEGPRHHCYQQQPQQQR